MVKSKRFRHPVLNKPLSVYFVILLLFVYLAGSVNSLHSFIHHESAELHSEENEKEACHQAIYHGGGEEGCHHKIHLTKNDKCSLCHIIVHSEPWLTNDISLNDTHHQSSFVEAIYKQDLVSLSRLLPARAPPVA